MIEREYNASGAFHCFRFGTVNGPSPNMRIELMLNSMVYWGMKDGKITVSNPMTKRAILDIDLLTVTFSTLIGRYVYGKTMYPGTYNLMSLNMTVGELAEVARKTIEFNTNGKLSPIIETIEAPASKYSFYMSDQKLRESYPEVGALHIGGSAYNRANAICNRLYQFYEQREKHPTISGLYVPDIEINRLEYGTRDEFKPYQ